MQIILYLLPVVIVLVYKRIRNENDEEWLSNPIGNSYSLADLSSKIL